jgi:hypothetical protein
MDKPTVPEILPLVRALYQRHGAGCCWHCVLDDMNLDRYFVESAAKRAEAEGHPDCVALIKPLLAMSRTQLKKLYYRNGRSGW